MQLIKLFQWNTLADTFSDKDAFPKVESDKFLTWEYRSQQIAAHIQQNQADVYCFEEVDHPEFFQSLLPNYHFIYHKKPAPANKDGIFVAYRQNMIVKEVEIVPFIENNKIANQFFIKIRFAKYDFVAFGLHVKHLIDFAVIITHLKAKQQFEEIRKSQLTQLCNYLTDANIIFCGDLNTQPHLEAVQHFVELSKMSTINTTLPTTSKNRGVLETNIKDYIFYKGVKLKNYQVGPQGLQIGESGLPSEQFPSDHLFLIGEFEI